MNTQQIKDFILAGNALFTLKSLKTGKHFTYKVTRAVNSRGELVSPPTWKVNALWGRDNTKDYHFIGTLRNGKFFHLPSNVPSMTGFAWCWAHLDRCGERFEFAHAGRCGRCNRLLTVPSSIESGIGPECQDKLAFEAAGGADGLLNQLFGEHHA